MGTASQSISPRPDDVQRKEFEDLVKEALGRSSKRTEQLDIKLRQVVNQVLFGDPVLAGVRPAMTTAINNKVRTEITDKLRAWVAAGKKLADWPFKDIEVDV